MELDSTSPERGLQSSGLCIFTHLLHMLAMTPTPGIINVCGGAAHSTIMSVSGALLLCAFFHTALKVRPERGGAPPRGSACPPPVAVAPGRLENARIGG